MSNLQEQLAPDAWTVANQQYLVSAAAEVRLLLERRLGREDAASPPKSQPSTPFPPGTAPAIERLCDLFHLTAFERAVILLCAGIELDQATAALCAEANGDAARPWPTFSVALAVLPDPHWSAVTPAAPLRKLRLIELGPSVHQLLMTRPLKIDERILHYLTGISYTDERLSVLATAVEAPAQIVPSHESISDRIVGAWKNPAERRPMIELYGADETTRRDIAAVACRALDLNLRHLDIDAIPSVGSPGTELEFAL